MKGTITITYKPIYELLMSLVVFSDKALLKNSETESETGIKAKKKMKPELQKLMQKKDIRKELNDIMELMVIFHEQDLNSINDFYQWFKNMSISELSNYASLKPGMLQDFIPRLDNLQLTDKLLSAWDEHYFSQVYPEIEHLLINDAAEKNKMLTKMEPQQLIEEITNGVWIDDMDNNTFVYLVPQYHARPLNMYTQRDNLFIAHYPIEILPRHGEPSPKLVRMTSALCDSKRLKILQFLNREERTFMDVVSCLDVSKSTVHYHMASLRAAGLIRVKMSTTGSLIYSLRNATLDSVSQLLKDFIEQPVNDTNNN